MIQIYHHASALRNGPFKSPGSPMLCPINKRFYCHNICIVWGWLDLELRSKEGLHCFCVWLPRIASNRFPCTIALSLIFSLHPIFFGQKKENLVCVTESNLFTALTSIDYMYIVCVQLFSVLCTNCKLTVFMKLVKNFSVLPSNIH